MYKNITLMTLDLEPKGKTIIVAAAAMWGASGTLSGQGGHRSNANGEAKTSHTYDRHTPDNSYLKSNVI